MSLVDTFVEVKLVKPDTFLMVKETLSRIGIASKRDQTLYPSCHILHKRGKLYIVHFKELLALDGKETNFDDCDLARRNAIANMLEDWRMIDIVSNNANDPVADSKMIKVIPHREKRQWNIIYKYTLGKR